LEARAPALVDDDLAVENRRVRGQLHAASAISGNSAV
jgi:hypothetical protein